LIWMPRFGERIFMASPGNGFPGSDKYAKLQLQPRQLLPGLYVTRRRTCR
jgi:hypothetical protein